MWEPRYLAYPAAVTLPLLTLDLVRLVSRHPEEEGEMNSLLAVGE
ncbi:hypothetical protein ACFSQ7_03790 [Paenibacillus rhizoplanae]